MIRVSNISKVHVSTNLFYHKFVTSIKFQTIFKFQKMWTNNKRELAQWTVISFKKALTDVQLQLYRLLLVSLSAEEG